ncbi:hypothetical protein D3C81_1286070 [compost metagenome]
MKRWKAFTCSPSRRLKNSPVRNGSNAALESPSRSDLSRRGTITSSCMRDSGSSCGSTLQISSSMVVSAVRHSSESIPCFRQFSSSTLLQASSSRRTTTSGRVRPSMRWFSTRSTSWRASSARIRPSSASRMRCSSSSLRRRSAPVKTMKSSSSSEKIAGSSVKSLSRRIITCSIFWNRLSRCTSFCSPQPSAAEAISLSRRRAGWPPWLKKVLSSTATLSMGICIRPINALSESGRERSSRMNSKSIDTRLMTSSSTWPTTRERPLRLLTRISN